MSPIKSKIKLGSLIFTLGGATVRVGVAPEPTPWGFGLTSPPPPPLIVTGKQRRVFYLLEKRPQLYTIR